MEHNKNKCQEQRFIDNWKQTLIWWSARKKEVYMDELNKKLEEAYIVIAMLQAELAETKK